MPYFANHTTHRPAVRLVGVLLALFAGLALVGCGGENASTECNLNSCTVTFERGGNNAKVEVLGVEAKLKGVKGDTVTLDVAGNEVKAKVGQQVDVQGFRVEVQEVTDAEVVVEISQADGG